MDNLENKTAITSQAEKKNKRSKEAYMDLFFNPVRKDESSFNLKNISLDRITPRSINKYSQRNVDRLAKSIEKIGRLIHPIILVDPRSLPKDSSVLAEYKKQGVDPESLDLIIVAGERRYRAFKLLRDSDDQKIAEGILDHNRYDTITANILTPEEAQKEENYYEDSNIEARQLTPQEVIPYIEIAFEELEGEDKEKVLEELNRWDPEHASTRLNLTRYAKWFLETAFSITDWNDRALEYHISIAKNCSDRVKNALSDGRINRYEADRIKMKPKDEQDALIDLLEEQGRDAFKKELAKIDEEEKRQKELEKKKKESNQSSASVYKRIDKSKAVALKEAADLTNKSKNVSGKAKILAEKLAKLYGKIATTIEEYER